MATVTNFDPQTARAQFEERLGSLEADTNRCFWKIPGGPGEAYFPPVFYAFATIDYFSSYWAGWNDPAGDRTKRQTVRLVDFMVEYLGYDQRASKIAVAIWRHKLMHTAQPRVLRSRNGIDQFTWETGIQLKDHVTLSATGKPNEFMVRFDSYAVVCDLRQGVFGRTGYLADLCASRDLQQRYLTCFNEMENYTVNA